jgi:hypothetical protein
MTAANIVLAICMIGLNLPIYLGMTIALFAMIGIIWRAKHVLVGKEKLWEPPRKNNGKE